MQRDENAKALPINKNMTENRTTNIIIYSKLYKICKYNKKFSKSTMKCRHVATLKISNIWKHTALHRNHTQRKSISKQ